MNDDEDALDGLSGYDAIRAVYGEDSDESCTAFQMAYSKSRNPWYLFAAVGVVETNKLSVPQWIQDALFDAAAKVATSVIVQGFWKDGAMPPSMDAALGLTTKRGGRPYYTTLESFRRIDSIFHVIDCIRACYDVSIEQACQCAYYFIDVDDGFVRAELVNEAKKRGRFASESDYQAAYSDAVKEGEKTLGEKFGASLDSLIDRYHREGRAHRKTRHCSRLAMLKKKADQEPGEEGDAIRAMLADEAYGHKADMWHWLEELLGMQDYADVWAIPEADARKFPMRPEFKALADAAGL